MAKVSVLSLLCFSSACQNPLLLCLTCRFCNQSPFFKTEFHESSLRGKICKEEEEQRVIRCSWVLPLQVSAAMKEERNIYCVRTGCELYSSVRYLPLSIIKICFSLTKTWLAPSECFASKPMEIVLWGFYATRLPTFSLFGACCRCL